MKINKTRGLFLSRCACFLIKVSIVILFSPVLATAQPNSEKGLPFITNYLPKTYKALPQTWSIIEDDRGIMYFGIQNYVLEYDGIKWRKLKIPSNSSASVVRSMAKYKDGTIYYGAYGDMGMLEKDSLGQTILKSISELIPSSNRDFLDVWTAYATENSIYFQAREYIFRLDKTTGDGKKSLMKVWKPASKFMYAFYLDETYYVHQQGLGLYKMQNDSLVIIPGSQFLGKERVQIMLPYTSPEGRGRERAEKEYLVGMFYGGLYLFNGKTFRPFASGADELLKSGTLLYKGLLLKNGSYVLSTTGSGLTIIDARGNQLQRINRDVGLQDESVYSAYEDKKGTLWLALDNGISRVETASPLTQFTVQSGINTGVLSINRLNGILYIGTTNGLLRFNDIKRIFEPVTGIPQNQIFNLQIGGDQLLVPGDGLFAIKDGKAVTIRRSVSGDLSLSALSLSKKHPGILLGGGTSGVTVFTRQASMAPSGWHYAGNIPGIPDQIWTFTENSDGTIWAGTQNGVVYRLTLAIDQKGNPDLNKTGIEKYGAEHGYKNGLGAVYSVKGTSFFVGDSSLFTFNESQKRFIPDSSFGTFPNGGGTSEFLILEDHLGRVWIRFGKETRLATPKPGGGFAIEKTGLQPIDEKTIQNLYVEKNGIVWICSTDGLIRYDETQKKNYDQPYTAVLRHISAEKTTLSTNPTESGKPVPVSYKNNTLRFEYAAPFFEQEDKTQYQTWLEGFEKEWSGWDNNYYKEFTNLPAGRYHFHVRAKNIYQKVSDEAVYAFSILPPWYATWWAYLLYALAAAALIYALVRWRTHQLHEKHRELEKTVKDRTAQLSHRVEELAVINSVQEGLVREMNMEGIYELVGEKIRQIFNAQVIDIVTYDSKTNLMEDRYAYEKGDRTLVGTWEPYGFRKRVIESRQYLLINKDLAQESRKYDSRVLHGQQPKSVLFVPMVTGNEVKGMISLQDLDKENAFKDSDVRLLTTLANSMSVALESARRFDETNRLLKETEQRNAELAVINSVQESLVAKIDMQGIYELVGEKIREIFDAQVIDIVTYDKNTNLIEDRYAYEKGDRTMLGPREVKGFRKHVIETRQLLLHNENVDQKIKEFNNEILIGDMPKSQMYVPMIAGNEVKGIISLQNLDHEHAFSNSDVSLLTTLANSMSVALESARLFDETNRLLKETEQRTAELSVINSVQEGLAKELDIQGIYELVGEKMREIFNAQVIDIVTYNKTTSLIEDRYGYEKGRAQLIGPRPLKGFRKHVVESAKPLVINKNVDQERIKYDNVVLQGSAAKSLVMVPMIAGNEVNGVISLQNIDQENAFSDSDVNLLTTLVNSMSVALENARLFDETNRLLKETEQRTAELAVINSVQEGLAKELDMQGIYNLVGDRVQKLFSAQAVIIGSFDLENKIEHFNYLVENGEIVKADSRPINKLRQLLIDKKKSIYITTEKQAREEYGLSAIAGTQMSKSLLFVPLLTGNIVKGYVSLQNVDKENAFSESDIRLLETLANSMSVALENARLFDETNRLLKETEQRTAELAIINSVQEGLASKLDIQAIYDLVGDKIRDVFDTQGISISYYDRQKNFITHPYYLFKGKRIVELGFELGKGLTSHIIQTGQPLLINQNAAERFKELGAVFAASESEDTTKSWLGVPLISGGQVNGTIRLENYEREFAYNESDVSLLQTLANSMSVALENARLFDETNRLLKETEQRTAELAVINSVQEGLAKELDMQGIYDLVGDRVQKLFNAQVVLIASFDLENKIEHFNYFFENDEKVKAESRPINKLRQLLIDNKQSIYIDTEEKGRKEYGLTPIGDTKITKSNLFVPLLTGNVIRGYVSLQNVDTEHAFSRSDIRLLETLANSMSVALENARLFDETNRLLKETEQRTAELAVINSVQEGLAKELDIQGIYDLVGERIRNLFDAQVVVIRTFDYATGNEHLRYAIEKGERIYVEPRPYMWANKQLIKSKESLLINENYLETTKKYGGSGIPNPVKGQTPKSALFVPMMLGDVVKGSISLQNVDKENAFTESDLRLLTTLSNSMSVALENARLFDETTRLLKETEQRTAELAVINSVQEGLAKELDIQGIYNLVGDRLCDLFPDTQTLVIRTFDHETGLEHFQYAIEKGARLEVEPRPFMWANQQLIRTKKPVDIKENYLETAHKFGSTGVTKGQPPKSAVFVPMVVGDIVKGSISLQNVDRENAFSESDLRLLTTLTNSMSVALENARLFDETNRLLKETEQRTAELAVINSVQEGLARELDINGIYELVGDRLCNLFPDTQTLVIRTFDHESGLEHWQYSKEKGVRQYVDPRPFNWNSKQLILNKKPLDIKENYVETAKKFGGSGVTSGQPPKSALFVPMLVGDLVKGSVSLQNVDKENAFNESDLRLLTTITNSMSVALENARLFDETNRLLKETEQRTAELAVINSVQEGLVREMNIQAIYDLVGNRICELFDTQTVLIRTFDHRTGLETWQYVIEKGQRLYSNPRPFMWANKELIKNKQPLLINEDYVETAKKYGGTGVSKGLPPKSALFVPMIVGDSVRGSVSLQNVEKENAFTDSDLRLLTTLTNSMSVALENARLFDETNRLLGEAKQRANELSTVNNISQALASQLNLDDLIKLVGDEMLQLFRANIVYLALLDKKTNTISFPYQYGDNLQPMKLGEGLTSQIILNGEPLLINKDVSELTDKLGVQRLGIPAASYLGVPIPVGDEVIGVISVQSTEHENRFNENDLRLLTTIASSFGVALRKAKLFEEVHFAKMEAETARKTAEQANAAKSAFLSTVSHELRTPLTSVLGFAKIIKKRLEEKIFPVANNGDAKTARTVQQISDNLKVVISEGERLTNLINEVLDLAKIEAGKMEWNMESVSVEEIAERAIAATSSLFEQKNLKLKKHIDNELPVISGDKDKLIQVIVNLISNAVKFTPEGTVTCRINQQGEEIVVGISDTGIGIAPEDHEAVFEQFKQVVGDTLTDKPKGTGLGLPICKEIVEHHGGRIWLESELGKGSTFFFALPVQHADSSKPVHLKDLVRQLKEQMAKSELNIKGKNATILVVDDDDSIRSLLQQELSDAGYIIEEASNGKEALEKIRKNRPDLIILDIMMPEINGFDVAAILKNDPETMDIPIIVLSIVQDKARGYRIGVDRYLTKPIDTAALFAEVGALLEQGKSKKKVMVVDEDSTSVRTLTDVLQAKGYHVVESDGKELVEKAISTKPDIIILNSVISDKQEIIQSLRFEKGLENVLFLIYNNQEKLVQTK